MHNPGIGVRFQAEQRDIYAPYIFQTLYRYIYIHSHLHTVSLYVIQKLEQFAAAAPVGTCTTWPERGSEQASPLGGEC
jgi:hypothetical protein